MADEPKPPIAVDPNSAAKDQAGAFLRDMMIVVSVIPALVAVLGHHDFNEMVRFIESQQAAPALGVILAAATLVWRQWRTRRKATQLITAARSANDEVAYVKGEPHPGDMQP